MDGKWAAIKKSRRADRSVCITTDRAHFDSKVFRVGMTIKTYVIERGSEKRKYLHARTKIKLINNGRPPHKNKYQCERTH